jgi:hypothetical protein
LAPRGVGGETMFNPTQLVIDTFVEQMKAAYVRTYGLLEPEYPNVIAFVGRIALENIANSDAPYHDVNHTILVTEVGQEILKGRHISQGGVGPRDWLHFVISLLCHDIGYVRGVCFGDRDGTYVTDADGKTVTLPPGATDASLTPYHVTRSQIFVRERFGKVGMLDCDVIARNIEHTRFPVPGDGDHASTIDYPGLVRASDLIGQLADINYRRKVPALFTEFQETGTNARLGYATPADLRHAYPTFFWKAVTPFIQDGLRYLRVTQEGKQWMANLYAHVFAEEHHGALGDDRVM